MGYIRSHMRSCLRSNGKTQRENDDSSLHLCIEMVESVNGENGM